MWSYKHVIYAYVMYACNFLARRTVLVYVLNFIKQQAVMEAATICPAHVTLTF